MKETNEKQTGLPENAFRPLKPGEQYHPLMSPDNLRSMQIDNVSDGRRNFPGWRPRSLESVVPGYLAPIKLKQRLNAYRCRAGR